MPSLPPTHSLLQLIVTMLFTRGITMVLSLAFVLIAPNIIADRYSAYVYYTRLLAVFNLLLALGSCGVINRFGPNLTEEGVDHMMGHVMRRKYVLFVFLLVGCVLYAMGAGNYIWLGLLVIALVKAIGDAVVLLLYSHEQYSPRLYGQVLFSSARLIALPIQAISTVLYIGVYEIITHGYTLYVFGRTYPFRRIGQMLRARRHDIFSHIDRPLHRQVEIHTYLSNFLFSVLPLAPILIINNIAYPHVRDVSITYMIAIGVVYTLVSSVNDVILPKLLCQRESRRSVISFLLGSIAVAGAALLILLPLFSLLEDVVIRHYDMQSFSSIRALLFFSACLVVINSNRQVLYIYDRIGWLNGQLLGFYVCTVATIALGLPILGSLAILSLLLALATSITAILFMLRTTRQHA